MEHATAIPQPEFCYDPYKCTFLVTRPYPAGLLVEAPRPGTHAPGQHVALVVADTVPADLVAHFCEAIFDPTATVERMTPIDLRVGGYDYQDPQSVGKGGVLTYPFSPGHEDGVAYSARQPYSFYGLRPDIAPQFGEVITLHYLFREKEIVAVHLGLIATHPPLPNTQWDDDGSGDDEDDDEWDDSWLADDWLEDDG